MSVMNPYQQYKQNQVQTAGGGTLVMMVYDAILRNIRHARAAIEKKDMRGANGFLIKAQDLISELMFSLNFETGEIARGLYSLYDFSRLRLIQANVKKDLSMLEEVYAVIESLRSGWSSVLNKENR